MARFSIGTSIGDAFALIRRRPLSVFVWGLLLLAPAFASVALLLPVMGEMFANMPTPAGAGPDDAAAVQMAGEMMQFQLISMLLNIGQLLMAAVIYTAVFRAVIRPREDSLFSLRLGMDELRVAVVGLAIGVGLYAVILLFAIVGMAVGFAVSTGGDAVLTGVVIGLLVLALLAGLFLGLARVSLMAPASVLYRDFAFVQGWRLAAGKTLPLFGLMVVIFLMILLFEIAVIAAVMVVAGFGAMGDLDWSRLSQEVNPFAGINAWIVANWYWAALAGLVLAFVYGALTVLSIAPFASACRQLAEGDARPVADDRSPPSVG